MADILCPQCGKWNPAGAIRCQYCSYVFDIPEQEPPAEGWKVSSGAQSNMTKILGDLAGEEAGGESAVTGEEKKEADSGLPNTRLLNDLPSSEKGSTAQLSDEPSETPQDTAKDIWPLAEEISEDQAALLKNLEKNSANQGDEDGLLSSELPDWLSGVSNIPEPPAPPASVAPSESDKPAEGEVPEWLAGLESKGMQEEKKDEPSDIFDLGNPPDWLVKLQSEENLPDSQPAGAGIPAFLVDEHTSDSSEPSKPFSSDEGLPDWLARMSLPEEKSAVETKETEENERRGDEITLAPAEIPGWVQSLQPVETVSPASPEKEPVEDQVEQVGPLSGLRGVLPSETFTPNLQKSVIYPIDLQVSEKQRINATLFNNILTSEGTSQVVQKKGEFPLREAFRILVACCLILTIWLPLLKGSHAFSSLGYTPVEVKDTENVVAALNSNSVVLLAVDYEPALSGEINSIAVSAVADLMSKSANLVLISTNPMGQVLGEQLLTKAQATQSTYSLTDKTLNLGYLAGGVSGLYDLAIEPRLITPSTVDQKSAWDQPILLKFNSLSDFSAVMVITDNADTARSWIEQVQPVLGKTPMVMVTSAQVGPMLMPYFDASQVQGLVAGISEGKIFEENTSFAGATGSSSQYWDSYQIGILLAVILIAIGGVYAVSELIIAPRKSKKEA